MLVADAMTRSLINTYPSQDGAFRRAVERIANDTTSDSPDTIVARLRPLYPKVAVFERQLSGEPPRFYAYRDGRYAIDRREPWWDEPGVPCVHISAGSGQISRVTGEWAELMGGSPGTLVGRHFTDFLEPAAQPAARGMFEAVVEDREVTSKALVLRVDGSRLLIEFHARRRDGEIEIHYRPANGDVAPA